MKNTIFSIAILCLLAIPAQAQSSTSPTGADVLVLKPIVNTTQLSPAIDITTLGAISLPTLDGIPSNSLIFTEPFPTTAATLQTSTATATITISRNSAVSQADANQKLARDIERFMLQRYPGINGATAKNGDPATCQTYSITETRADGSTRSINLEIYNRDANTCLPVLNNGKTDLVGINTLSNVLQRAMRLLFDELSDAQYVKEAQETTTATVKTDLSTRVAEKP
ncbi:MAG: hypothetical protein ACO24O_04375 [Arenimonas sp.]